jgi:hypothetical protein
MNIEVVKSVFGAVAPPPVIAEKKSNLLPIILLVVVVGVGVAIYIDSEKYDKEETFNTKIS